MRHIESSQHEVARQAPDVAATAAAPFGDNPPGSMTTNPYEQSAEAFRVLEAVPVPLVVAQIEGHRLLAANAAARRALALGAGELGSLEDYLPGAGLGMLELTSEVVDVEMSARRADGQLVAIRSWFRPAGDPPGLVHWSFVDASERRQVQDELARQNAILRSVLQTIGEGVVVADATGRFTLWNDAAKRLVGIGPVDSSAPEWSDVYGVFLPDGRPYPSDMLPLARAMRGEEVRADLQLVRNPMRPQGVWLLVNGWPLREEDGELRGGVVVFRDVTLEKQEQSRLEAAQQHLEQRVANQSEQLVAVEAERRLLEDQLRQAQKMEAVGRLAGGIAHDFNNLLMAIISFSTFARDELSANDPARSDVEEAIKAAKRAAELTKQLLAFSRQQVIQPRVLSVNSVVRDADKMLRRILGEDVHLETHVAAELWSTKIDPSHFEQVLVNLAVNARDAMTHGGKLTIETDNVALDDSYTRQHPGVQPGDYVMLAVSDNGPGMTDDVRSRIFEPFFTTKPKGQGTGLGLATCYGIVKQAGGHIYVYSEIGRGSTFKIYLPRVTDAPEEHAAHDDAGPVARGTETILVVEDEEAVRMVAVRILRKSGYHVLEARNAGEALLACEAPDAPHIDLLLTDVVMPGLGGRGLSERLQKLHPDLKVIYMSGYTDNAIVHHGVLDSGMVFLQKPFAPDLLVKRVHEVLTRHEPA